MMCSNRQGNLFTACEVYNLGTGKGTTVLEMVAAFEKASGKVKSSSLLLPLGLPVFVFLWMI